MAGTGAGYDLSCTTFSPDGRVFQVEYATKAVENSGTCVALCCKDGVIFACEKFLRSSMLVPGTSKRIFPINRHTGVVFAGLLPDAREFAHLAREEAINFKKNYDEEIPAVVLAERLGLYAHVYTRHGGSRPFGCAALLGAVDKDTKKPSLYNIEPSGQVYKYTANANGKGRMAAKTELEKLVAEAGEDFTCEKVLTKVARIIYKVHDEKDKNFELEVHWICPQSQYEYRPVPADLLKTAEAEAKRMIEAEEDED